MDQPHPAISRPGPVGRFDLPRWLIAIYLVAIMAGAALLRAPGMLVRGNELSMTEAAFSAINAATLTGFDPQTTLGQYTPTGRWVVLGLIAGGTLISLIVGGILVARIIRLDVDEGRLARRAMALFGAGVMGGTVLIWNAGRPFFDALFLACSAIGNCGLATGYAPPADGWATHGVVLPLAFVGALGIVVVVELIAAARRRQPGLSAHSRAALVGMLGVYLAGAVALAGIALAGGALPDAALVGASAGSMDARTSGFGYAAPEGLARSAQWVVMLLMAIGGASGGVAGGIKVTTCIVICGGVRALLAGRPAGHALGIALVWVGLYIGLIVAGMVALLMAQPQIPADRMLFEVTSALGNVGLAFGPVSMTGSGMVVLCILMLAGRFLPFWVLLWMARTTRGAETAVG